MTILFDLDGTLIDSTDAILESFEVAYKSFKKVVPDHDEIKSLIGYPLDNMFERLGIHADKWDYVRAYKEHYRVISRAKTTLLPLALESIKEASTIASLGIVTTKTAKYSQELLEHMEVMQYFDVLIGREDVDNPKPHEEPILKAIKNLNSDKNTTWMIGDTALDLQSARNAGVKSVGVTCGYGKKKELDNYTQYVVNNAYEAVKIIQNNK